MRNPDRFNRRLNRVKDHINYHKDHPQADPMRGDIGWDYIAVMDVLMQHAINTGFIVVAHKPEKPVPGGAALRKKDVA